MLANSSVCMLAKNFLWNDVKLCTDLFNLDTLTVIAQFRCMVTDELFTNIHNLFTISAVIFSPFAQLVSHLCGQSC